MVTRLPSRYRTGDDDLDRRIVGLLDAAGASHDRDQLFEILVSGVNLAGDGADRPDLKITSAALKEMRAAFRAFAPWEAVPKVTIFGSARTQPDDPLYAQARELPGVLAERGWIIVTGAGPGIMAAGFEGAGREQSFGVSIRLPFETNANEFIAGDDKLISMKYFFTRKLMLIKESRAFVSLPGGFGTLDEAFELLTLQQTGKSVPAPIVLLDVPGGTYWHGWERFVRDEVLALGLISAEDLDLVCITDDVDEACAQISGFYRTYPSLRWVGNRLVLRLEAEPTGAEVASLNDRFAHLCTEGAIVRTAATSAERRDRDEAGRPRLVLTMDIFHLPRLRSLIDAINALDSAPELAHLPPA